MSRRYATRRIVAFSVANFVLGNLPRRISYPLMATVGLLVATFCPGTMSGLRANLEVVCPGLSEREMRRLLRRNAANYGKFWVDLFRVPHLTKAQQSDLLSIDGLPYLETILSRGNGCLVASLHMGAWEGCVAFWANTDHRTALVAEVLEPPALWRKIRQLRESTGLELVPLGRHAPRDIIRRLRENGIIAFAMDRDLLGSGKTHRFFGRPTPIPTGMVEVARRTGAGIMPVLCLRDVNDNYKVIADAPMFVADEPGAVDATVERLLRIFEGWIRAHPDQWHVMEPLWRAGSAAEEVEPPELEEVASVG